MKKFIIRPVEFFQCSIYVKLHAGIRIGMQNLMQL